MSGHYPGPIHLAELITALADLPWQDAAQAQAIAGSLGFGLAAPKMQAGKTTETIYDPTLAQHDTAPDPGPAPAHLAMPPAPPLPVGLPDRVLNAVLTPLPQRAPAASRPDWLDEDYQVYRPEPGPVQTRHPLFPEVVARGVFTAALATLRHGDELDVAELVRQVVRGHLPHRLPRQPAATLARGCQVLLDFNDTLLPWWEDLRDLARQISQVVGADAVEIHEFEGNPNQARRWLPNGGEQPWQPHPGRPILLATDFGIQGRRPARPGRDWTEFIKTCARHGSPLVILVPWPPRYWPGNLGPHLMHWHPRTSAAMIRRKLGLGHRVRP